MIYDHKVRVEISPDQLCPGGECHKRGGTMRFKKVVSEKCGVRLMRAGAGRECQHFIR